MKGVNSFTPSLEKNALLRPLPDPSTVATFAKKLKPTFASPVLNVSSCLFGLSFLLIALSVTSSGSVAHAQTEQSQILNSHWGLAAGTGWIQDYPGAGQGRMRYLALPTFKGKVFSIDRQDGVKGEFIDDRIFKFAVSFSFLFPTSSSKMPVRAGMPGIDWVFQMGPELQIYLYKSAMHTMYLRLPLRFIATTDFRHDFQYRQWNFSPSLRNNFLLNGWGEIMTRLEFDYASEAYNDLFYEVAPKYATAARPVYDARSGLLEWIIGMTYSYNEIYPWGFSIGANVYLLQASANRDSPLLVNQTNYSVLASVVRYF
jgi:MipA family protein